MASRECEACHTQINTCDVCGADWPTNMVNGTNDGQLPPMMLCNADYQAMANMLGGNIATIATNITAWRNSHPQ